MLRLASIVSLLDKVFIYHFWHVAYDFFQIKPVVYTKKMMICSPGEVLMVQDFAENRKSQYHAEAKSAFYGKKQISLHPTVVFYWDQEGQQVCIIGVNTIRWYIIVNVSLQFPFELSTTMFVLYRKKVNPYNFL